MVFFFFLFLMKQFGVWITTLIAFDNHSGDISLFLNDWYYQTLKYSTQDQVSFPFVAQRLYMIPYTLPDVDIWGNRPHEKTLFYNKRDHGSRKKLLFRRK